MFPFANKDKNEYYLFASINSPHHMNPNQQPPLFGQP